MVLTSTAEPQGDTVSIAVPAEAARRLGVGAGDDLYWVEDGLGGYHVTPVNPERAAMLRAHEEIMTEYRDLFAALVR